MFCALAQEIKTISDRANGFEGTVQVVGKSLQIRQMLAKAARFASASRPVLISGESGVGKELIARSIYLLDKPHKKQFYATNCAQYRNDDLLVSELFGHKKGSFTGARSDHAGLFEEGDGGVVFLDEVGELPPHTQAMLLRVLGEGEITPLGSVSAKHVNVRVIAATNQCLWRMVRERRFRDDLFYRLNCFALHIPPVRKRGGDWRLLVQHFLDHWNCRAGSKKVFSKAAWRLMESYHWPGNVREIENVVARGYYMTTGNSIKPDAFREALLPNTDAGETVESLVADRLYKRMAEDRKSFWTVVRGPYMNRDLNRAEVKATIRRGLQEVDGSYKRLLKVFAVSEDQYLKFMDFLRHHDLKP